MRARHIHVFVVGGELCTYAGGEWNEGERERRPESGPGDVSVSNWPYEYANGDGAFATKKLRSETTCLIRQAWDGRARSRTHCAVDMELSVFDAHEPFTSTPLLTTELDEATGVDAQDLFTNHLSEKLAPRGSPEQLASPAKPSASLYFLY